MDANTFNKLIESMSNYHRAEVEEVFFDDMKVKLLKTVKRGQEDYKSSILFKYVKKEQKWYLSHAELLKGQAYYDEDPIKAYECWLRNDNKIKDSVVWK